MGTDVPSCHKSWARTCLDRGTFVPMIFDVAEDHSGRLAAVPFHLDQAQLLKFKEAHSILSGRKILTLPSRCWRR